VTRLAVAGVGDAAINDLHDPADMVDLASAFAAADAPEGTTAGRIRRNAELAGNDPRALLPFLQQGGWPGGLSEVRPVQAPTLVVLAERDEHMARADVLLDRLGPTKVLRVPGRGHDDVLQDETVQREVATFLAG
jgi:hypothetical protein